MGFGQEFVIFALDNLVALFVYFIFFPMLLPFGWIHLLKALKSKPKVIDLYLTGVLPEYQSKGVNALLFNDLIPVYKRIGAVYAESNPELETNSAVQAQWDYFKREHHKSRRAYIKKL